MIDCGGDRMLYQRQGGREGRRRRMGGVGRRGSSGRRGKEWQRRRMGGVGWRRSSSRGGGRRSYGVGWRGCSGRGQRGAAAAEGWGGPARQQRQGRWEAAVERCGRGGGRWRREAERGGGGGAAGWAGAAAVAGAVGGEEWRRWRGGRKMRLRGRAGAPAERGGEGRRRRRRGDHRREEDVVIVAEARQEKAAATGDGRHDEGAAAAETAGAIAWERETWRRERETKRRERQRETNGSVGTDTTLALFLICSVAAGGEKQPGSHHGREEVEDSPWRGGRRQGAPEWPSPEINPRAQLPLNPAACAGARPTRACDRYLRAVAASPASRHRLLVFLPLEPRGTSTASPITLVVADLGERCLLPQALLPPSSRERRRYYRICAICPSASTAATAASSRKPHHSCWIHRRLFDAVVGERRGTQLSGSWNG
uniref:Uncharacterized protein n=1 Tax=Oryza punctata TaxID=4537 RepID=A0A1V1H0L3_ORYPU|nr:hypothetical protein [Oryza punctata]